MLLVAVLFVVAVALLWPARYGGITGLTVVSGHSMEPTFHTGDLLLSIKQPSYRVGDIVSYTVAPGQPGAGGRVIHRIIAVDASGHYQTRGDNNPDIDPWRSTARDVMGREIFSLAGAGTFLGPASAPAALGLVFGGLITGLIWRSDTTVARSRKRRAEVAA
jgi:signal peptidase